MVGSRMWQGRSTIGTGWMLKVPKDEGVWETK